MSNYKNSSDMGYDLILSFLSDRMEEKQITKYRLSKLTEIPESTISRYFSKKVSMSLTNFLKICGALEIRPYLIPKEDDSNKLNFINFN